MKRWPALLVVVALTATIVVGAPVPAWAGVNDPVVAEDPLTGDQGVFLNTKPTTSGQNWQGWHGFLKRSPTGAYAELSGTTQPKRSTSIVAVKEPNGEVEATFNFPARVSGERAFAGLVFRSGTAGYVYFMIGCASGSASHVGVFGRYDGTTWLDVGTSVPGVGACSSTHHVKVTFANLTYKAYLNGTLIHTVTDPGHAATPVTNFGAGILVYENIGSTGGAIRVPGMVLADFKVNGGCAASPVSCGQTTDADIPYYSCGRTIRDVGNGTYFVDLEAGNHDTTPSTQWADKQMWWKTSWGVKADTPAAHASNTKMTLALPPLNTMPPGGWSATFNVYREAGTKKIWGAGYWDRKQGEVRQVPQFKGGPLAPLWAPLARWAAWDSEYAQEVIFGVPHYTPEEWYGAEHARLPDEAVWVPGGVIGEASFGVIGTCTVRIDPLNPAAPSTGGFTGPEPPPDPAAPPTTTTTVDPAAPTTQPPPPSSGYNNQGQDGTQSDCSAGYLGRLPIIGGAFELVSRLICAMKQLFLQLFVPKDWGSLLAVSEFSAKFPGSWVAEGVESVSTLQSSLSTGVGGSACGPVMNVPAPAQMTVRFPGPAGCGGTGSSVTAGASEAYNVFGFRSAIRGVFTVLLYLGVVWRLIRLAPWTEGKDDGAPVVS